MISGPDYIQFYPTTRCNLSCAFCFNNNVPALGDMPFPDFRRMIAAIKAAGTMTLDIMGGEPTMHSDLMRFIRYARQEGVRINISSNGTGTNLLGEIRTLYPECLIGISVNDRKTFLPLERFIRQHRPVVKTVVGRALDALLINELLACEPARVYLLYQDALSAEQLAGTAPFPAFLRTIHEHYGPSRVGTVYCSGFLPDVQSYQHLQTARCPAGTTKLGILPDGSVYPCNLFFGFPEFRLGNILDTPFQEIWRHPLLSFFRAFGGNRCPKRECEIYALCHGGCPAHSLAHYGKRSAPEPRCVRE